MRRLVGACLVLVASFVAPQAREQVPAETRFENYSADLPGCADNSVLSTISSRFSQRESNYWQSSLTILSFEQPKQVAFRPNGIDLIPRRFCQAKVVTSDQKHRVVDYQIVENGGIIGATWGLEWCVSGLDRNYAYAPYCVMARP